MSINSHGKLGQKIAISIDLPSTDAKSSEEGGANSSVGPFSVWQGQRTAESTKTDAAFSSR